MTATIPNFPPTLGAFVRADWQMWGLCAPCNGVDKFKIDMASETARMGDDYSTSDWMRSRMCERCGMKLSLYDLSPADRKPIDTGTAAKWGKR